MQHRYLIGFVLGALVYGIAPSTFAGKEEFRLYTERAKEHYLAGRYEEAVTALLAAQRIRDEPLLWLNLGHAYKRLGRCQEAETMYQGYLMREPGQKDAVQAYLVPCKPEPVDKPAIPNVGLPELRPEPRPEAKPQAPRVDAPKPPLLGKPIRASGPPIQIQAPQESSLYKRWWFWGSLGVAAAGIVTVAVVSTTPWDPGLPMVPIHDARF